jgi:hypothetical protein
MNASGEASGHSCFQSHKSSASSFGRCTQPRLLLFLAPWPNRAFVDGFDHLHSGFFVLETGPSKGNQLARTQGVAHVELQQDTIAQRKRGESIPQLLPRECRLVRLSQMSRRGDLARRILVRKSCSTASAKMSFIYALICSTRSFERVLPSLLRCTCNVNRSKFSMDEFCTRSLRAGLTIVIG